MITERKKEIKNDMLNQAAAFWDVSLKDIESSFDPIVALLIDACAEEIAKISAGLDGVYARITDRLIQLMTPESIYGAKPAHSIAYTEPTEPSINISSRHQFYHKKKLEDIHLKFKDIFFSPVQDFKLVDAVIEKVFCGNQLFQVEEKMNTRVANFNHYEESICKPSTLYLGIKCNENKYYKNNEATINLKDVQLYFEFQNIVKREQFYHHLSSAKFYWQSENSISAIPGFKNTDDSEKINLQSIFDHTSSKIYNIERAIKDFYKKHFILLNDDIQLSLEGYIPEVIQEKADPDDLEHFKGLNWLKIEFPTFITDADLENVFCSLNAFPVLNRKLEHTTYQLKDYINIAPLSTNDLFLDIEQITNTSGETYRLQENDASVEDKGTYVMRYDHVAKLDARKAKDYLLQLIELLKNESAAFSAMGNDFLQSNIKALNQNITVLEDKAAKKDQAATDNKYVFLKPFKEQETLLIDFWATNGVEANQIKTGSGLNIYKSSDIKQNCSKLLTTSQQGKDSLTMKERQNTYRKALLSRGRVVTKEDIKALCYELCGDTIEEVKVQNSFEVNADVNKGFTPCIEIILIRNKKSATLEEGWDAIINNVLFSLEQQSLNVYPYNIKLK